MYKFINPVEKRLKIYEGMGLTLGIASGSTLEDTQFDEPVCVISIRTNENGELPDLSNTNAINILYLVFHDVDLDSHYKSALLEDERIKYIDKVQKHMPLITPEQAEQILNFVEKNKAHPIICQCEAGISRSAGVAAALSVIYNQTDAWIFDDPFFKPNMYVRRIILKEYSKKLNQD